MIMTDALLEVSNIETYYGPIMAIRGVSFQVPRGSIVTVLGANGAGKTTILKTVSGVMDPQKGTVTFAGRPIHGRDPDRIMRLGLSHVPEGSHHQMAGCVRELVEQGERVLAAVDDEALLVEPLERKAEDAALLLVGAADVLEPPGSPERPGH